jgi:hypothetical protein
MYVYVHASICKYVMYLHTRMFRARPSGTPMMGVIFKYNNSSVRFYCWWISNEEFAVMNISSAFQTDAVSKHSPLPKAYSDSDPVGED